MIEWTSRFFGPEHHPGAESHRATNAPGNGRLLMIKRPFQRLSGFVAGARQKVARICAFLKRLSPRRQDRKARQAEFDSFEGYSFLWLCDLQGWQTRPSWSFPRLGRPEDLAIGNSGRRDRLSVDELRTKARFTNGVENVARVSIARVVIHDARA